MRAAKFLFFILLICWSLPAAACIEDSAAGDYEVYLSLPENPELPTGCGLQVDDPIAVPDGAIVILNLRNGGKFNQQMKCAGPFKGPVSQCPEPVFLGACTTVEILMGECGTQEGLFTRGGDGAESPTPE